jgi:FKBP-type peptidyl-prolyl cis-trans isomerase SlpA
MSGSKLVSLLNVRQLDVVENSAARVAAHTNDSTQVYAHDEVGPQKLVSLHFSLALEEGEIIDSCFDSRPARFVVGDGKLLPGFETCLFGMKAGEEQEFTLTAEQAFGPRNPDNLQDYPRYRFPADLPLSRGLMLDFADQSGSSQAGIVDSFDSDNVRIDFNHPLAGRTVVFRARIIDVAAAQQDSSGH